MLSCTSDVEPDVPNKNNFVVYVRLSWNENTACGYYCLTLH